MSDSLQPDTSRSLAAFGVLAGPKVGATLPVQSPVATIGQGAHNDLVVDDDSVSKTHARLEFDHGAWRLTDLDSTNGTMIEGVRLAPQVPTPLAYGNSVRFGGVHLQFRQVDSADPEAARASFAPPPSAAPAAPRRIRLPVWLFLVILLLIAAVVAMVLYAPSMNAPAATEVESVSLLLRAGAPPSSP